MKPRLLDLFCCAGGAAMGYAQAGFEVVGVDIKPQPRYPFEFHQADAMAYPVDGFDAVHASPHCQRYSRTSSLHGNEYPDQVADIRRRLLAWGGPYVLENVPGAPLIRPLLLCGSMFGLPVVRHRLFESNVLLFSPGGCRKHVDCRSKHYGGAAGVVVAGHMFSLEQGRAALECPWMRHRELAQAVPPAYTRCIGLQLLAVVERRRACA